MKTRNYSLLVAALVLVAGLSGVMAQGKLGSTTRKVVFPPIADVVTVNAIEVSDGIVGFDSLKTETAFGYSFLGRTTGSLPGSFTLSMNCTPATPVPGMESAMTGGSWTLPVYILDVKGGYAGSLYGTIAKGQMAFDKLGRNANVYILLNVDGGTHAYNGVSGYATFVGTLTVDEKTDQTTLNGDLVFSILPTK